MKAAQTLLTQGTLLQDRYLINCQISKSLMGAVYRAVDQRFGSEVAIKQVLVWNGDLRDELHKAFEQEARLLNRLHHPSLPVVFDYFTEGDGQFLVMQFVPGQTLDELLKARGGPFEVEEVLEWADSLLTALEYLHGQEKPVIHRDIKPANLKLSEDGRLFLLDFGLAKESLTLSIHGYTKEYAPFEQIQGLGTDHRSDLYSLAATLYRLVTDKLPTDALTRAGSMLRGLPDPLKRAHEVNPSIPEPISSLLHVAMAQSPDDRFISAAAMREALREVQFDQDVTVVRTAEATRASLFIPAVPNYLPGNRTAPVSASSSGELPSVSPSTAMAKAGREGIAAPSASDGMISIRSKIAGRLIWLLIGVLMLGASVYAYRTYTPLRLYKHFNEASKLEAEGTNEALHRAIEEYNRALNFCRAGNSRIGEADILSGLGATYYEIGDYRASLLQYERALSVYSSEAAPQGKLLTLQNMGAVYLKLGEQSKAEQYFMMAKDDGKR